MLVIGLFDGYRFDNQKPQNTHPPISTFLFGIQELGILALHIINKSTGYVLAAYIVWTILDSITLSFLHFKYKSLSRRAIIPYTLVFIAGSVGYFFLASVPKGMLYGNYSFSIVGNIFVLIEILKRKEFDEATIMFLVFKLVGDSFAIFTYFDKADWLASSLCLIMPAIDCAAFVIGMKRYIKSNN